MKYILYLVCYILYPFSFLFIRKKNRYAFGSFAGAFNDNAKYLFIHTSNHCPQIQSAWISNNRCTVKQVRSLGLKAYWTYSPQGVWHALTSRYWFFNSYTSDIMYSLSGGAICINLWHGLGIKRIEYNVLTGPVGARYQRTSFKEVFCHPQAFRKPDYVLSSAPHQTHFFSTSFRIPPERCIEFGYPRNLILTLDESQRSTFIAQYESPTTQQVIDRMRHHSRVLIYMPTWRDSQRQLFTQGMDLERLNEVLKKHDELLILKPHSNVLVPDTHYNHSNILFVPGNTDVYPLLPYTSALITDYSSVLFDYLLMPDKDVILYVYDYDEYVKDRDLFYPYDENVVGRKVFDFDTLLDVIDHHDYTLDQEGRQRILDKFWGASATYNSCQKILDFTAGL